MRKLFLTFIMILIGSVGTIAVEKTNIYVLPAIFMSQNLNNEMFEQIYQNDRDFFKDTFVNNFKAVFKDTVDEISDKNKYNTFVVYLNLPRVSKNNIGSKSVKVYIPMTGTLNFANMATSEILYSESITERMEYKTTEEGANSEANLRDVYKKVYTDIVKKIVQNASQEFKPFAIEAKVADKYKNLYILDKGLSSGIAKGDLISDEGNNQLTILYSDLDYSIAVPIVGTVVKDAVYRKYSNSSLSQIKKPKILFVNDFRSEKFYNLFSAALGSNADFSLITVNKSFADMQSGVEQLNSGYSHSNIENRQIPEYFLKLYFISINHAKYLTNKDYNDIDKYGALVCCNIFNRQGEVLYSTCANAEVTDEDINIRKFSDDYQYDVLFKNVFQKLADNLAQNVKFQSATIPLDKIKEDTITLKDNNHILNYGDIVVVMKKIKTDNISAEVNIPTWIYKVRDINGSNIECIKLKPISDGIPNPSKKDFVSVNAIPQNKVKTSAYNFVIGNSAIDGNTVELSRFDNLAFNVISSTINLPVSVNSEKFREQIDELNNGGYGFRRKLKYIENKDDKTIEAKYKVVLLEQKKKSNLIEQKYNVVCGIKVNDGKNEPKKFGLKQQITIYVPNEGDSRTIEYELLKQIEPILKTIALKFK